MKKKVPQTVGECFALIEREMFEGPWVMGKDYTVCDGYLFTLVAMARRPTASTSTRRRRSPITSSASANGRRCASAIADEKRELQSAA